MRTLWRIFKMIILAVVLFFVVTFGIYITNSDMKLLAKLKPFFMKFYEKRKRERRI